MFTLINLVFVGVSYLLNAYMLILFISGIMHLVKADKRSQLVQFFHVLADPPNRWLRQRFPKLLVRTENGTIDLASFVLILGIGCILSMISYVQTRL